MTLKSFVGPIIHSADTGELVIHERAQIDVKDGKIIKINLNPDKNSCDRENVVFLKAGQFIIPGFIDAHIHAVQVPNLGTGYDKHLLEWLENYTFPLERQYIDEEFADKVFDAVVQRTLKLGTTTACYFASLYKSSSLILAKKVVKYGQRAFVGKINMNSCQFEDYFESLEDSIKETEGFIEDVRKMNSPLVEPIISPRFALSCDTELMAKLGDLAKEKNVHVQTHISENKEEVEAVKTLFAQHPSYAEVYDAAGLLTDKTVLAHGVHLTDRELEIIKKRQTAIIHCPNSNTNLKSGLCDVRRLRAANIKVGLGTDVSGGNNPLILDTMRSALQASIHLSFIKSGYKPLDYKDVFYLATLGGAEALAINNKVGNFQVGKEFDALVIDLASPESAIDNLKDYSLDEKLQRLIYCGDDRNIVKVYVSGQCVVKK
ncbi:guanine deaminase [Copidosoma floridanum]|uniref:guanine deaminase n=1 Tax=Copidosoma floridanum TaxID=29053 RepID=UPI0006C9AF20|nr:guanine deaminase [Copidosoma floridanum]